MTSPIMMTSTMILEIVLREKYCLVLSTTTDLAYWQILILEGAAFWTTLSLKSQPPVNQTDGDHWVQSKSLKPSKAINNIWIGEVTFEDLLTSPTLAYPGHCEEASTGKWDVRGFLPDN
jgi:hypothetical protein